jgi:hypothetical protein
VTLLDQLRERRDTARRSAEQILIRATDEQRDLTSDELAEHREHVTAEREAADEADRVRDDQIAELRATAARRTGPPAPRGPVLTREQNVEDWARTRGLIPDDQPLSFDRYRQGPGLPRRPDRRPTCSTGPDRAADAPRPGSASSE